MLTFSKLGHFGRLGNQMFQYAALVGVAKRLGFEYGIPYKNKQKVKVGAHSYGLELLDIFDIQCPDIDINFETKYVYEKTEFDGGIFNITDNTDICGYFQSEKYFAHCCDEIRKQFTFKNKLKFQTIKSNINDSYHYIGVHVRKDDYNLLHNVYPACNLNYYIDGVDAVKSSKKQNKIVIFSDDIAWCKSVFSRIFKNYVVMYAEQSDHEHDLMYMSLCNAVVIANSSFSWWGAWLGNNKNVVAPKNWYTIETGFEWKDVYCDRWILM